MKKRNTNFELMRISAMLMVLTLHYLGKGGALIPYGSEGYLTINTSLAWFFEALAYPATNLFVLIFGYFGTKSEFKMEKAVKLWIQVFTYSAGVFIIMLLVGAINFADYKDIYKLAYYFMPISSRHYWFITFYLMLFMVSPFLNIAIRNMSRKLHLTLIIVCVLIFSKVIPTFVLTTYIYDDSGCGIVWFCIMYLIGAYIALYVPELKYGKLIPLVVYIMGAILMVANIFIFYYVDKCFGILSSWSGGSYKYNGLIVTVMSVALFIFFRNVRVENNAVSKVIRFTGPLTFGIYLLHEQELLKSFWCTLIRVPFHLDKPYFVLHMIVSLIIVFIVCGFVEWIRSTLTNWIYKLPPCRFIFDKINSVNRFFKDTNLTYEK